jgi:hypothetical protein
VDGGIHRLFSGPGFAKLRPVALPDISLLHWLLAAGAALLIGISKTGMPGAAILVAPIMATIFAGRLSPGALVPMLLFADFFAVAWYHRTTRWDHLKSLGTWIGLGVATGAGLLYLIGEREALGGSVQEIIAILVLAMIAVHLLRKRLGPQFQPTSKVGKALTGVAAGFSTTTANAAGPVTGVYLASAQLSKQEFIGTSAWLYLILNATKIPIYVALTVAAPDSPMITSETLLFNFVLFPVIFGGVFVGRWLLHRVSQNLFEAIVLALAGLTSLKLLFF